MKGSWLVRMRWKYRLERDYEVRMLSSRVVLWRTALPGSLIIRALVY